MPTSVELIVKAKDEASRPITQAAKSMQSLSDSVSKTTADVSKLDSQIDKMTGQLNAATPASMKLGSETGKAAANIKKSGDAVEGATGHLAKLKTGLNDVISGLTGFNLAQFTAVGAIVALGAGVKQAVTEYSAYVESVDKVSMSTGMASTEVSKLIQLADDFRVSQDALQNAMKLALQNGFNPTIENLAQLADRYKSIADPTQRAAEMQKIFGRSWVELVPLLERGGDAIRAASQGIEDGLIVTDKAIAENRQYVASLDNLSDSWTALKNKVGREAVPVLTDAVNFLSDFGDEQKKQKGTWEQWAGPVGMAIAAVKTLNKVQGDREKKTADVTAQIEAERAAQEKANEEAKNAADAQQAAAEFTKSMAQGYQAAAENTAAYAASQQRANDAMASGAGIAKNLQDATTNLNQAQANFNQSFGDKVISRLQAAGVKGADLEKVYAALDQRLGTNYVATNKADKALDAAVKTFKAKGNIDDFTAALDDNKTSWEDLDGSLQKAKQSFQDATTAWNNFITRIAESDGLRFVIYVDTVASGYSQKATFSGGGSGTQRSAQRALGGPVNMGSGYWVGENGPEWFRPWTGGYISNATDSPSVSQAKAPNTTIVMNNTINYPIDFEYAAQKIAGIIRRKGAT